MKILIIILQSTFLIIGCGEKDDSGRSNGTAQSGPPIFTAQKEHLTYDSIRTFIKTNKKISKGIRGSDEALFYSHSQSSQLLRYQHYNIIVSIIPYELGDCIEVYRRYGNYNPDSIIILFHDSLVFYSRDNAGWFEGIKNDFIFMDYGTGPEHTLDVIDLLTGKRICSLRNNETLIDSSYTIYYYGISDEEATKNNHPEFEKLKHGGLTPIIEEQFSYNTITKELKRLGNKRPNSLQ